NPVALTSNNTSDNQFKYPSVKVGPSPLANIQRLYILARNVTMHNGYPCSNPIIAWADVTDEMMESRETPTFHYTTIPEMDQWNTDLNTARIPYYGFTVDNSGNIYVVGYHKTINIADNQEIDTNDLDVFVCSNYGQGTWAHYAGSSKLPSWNPLTNNGNGAGYFCSPLNVPYADDQLFWKVNDSNHMNVVFDGNGNLLWAGIWTLFNSDHASYPELNTIREVSFNLSSNQFTLREVYPIAGTCNDERMWQPWDTDGDHIVDLYSPEDGTPIIHTDWNYCYWDDSAHNGQMRFLYNNVKITEPDEHGLTACVWQNSWKARQIHVYDDPDYTQFSNAPEIFISTSANRGFEWSEPIQINPVANQQISNKIPVWTCPSDKIKYQGISNESLVGRLWLMYYNDNSWGSYSLPIPEGTEASGYVEYMSIDIGFNSNSVFSGITGIVYDGITNHPIANATITCTPGNHSTLSNSQGQYSLPLQPGSYSLTAFAQEYSSLTLNNIVVNQSFYTTANFMMNESYTITLSVGAASQNDNNSVLIQWIPRSDKNLIPFTDDKMKRQLESKDLHRDIINYTIWRLLSGQESGQNLWIEVGSVPAQQNFFTDTSWGTLNAGQYRYAIKALYANENISNPCFSNIVTRYIFAGIQGVVCDLNSNPVPNANVRLDAIAPNEHGPYTCFSDNNGHFSFQNVWYGYYHLSCLANHYLYSPPVMGLIQANINQIHNIVLYDSLSAPVSASAVVINDSEASISWLMPERDLRNLVGLRIWRLLDSEVSNPNSWILVGDVNADTRSFTDNHWHDLNAGFFMYAVRSIYAGNLQSAYALTNSIEHVDVSDQVAVPIHSEITSVRPNPFHTTTNLGFILKNACTAYFEIYNSRGQFVRHLECSNTVRGENELVWNGLDDKGKQVPSGVYICRMNAQGKTDTVKILRIK
ncbi:MAG TPA: carboxypeptidase regulatory-like domain-containing protein, partial [Candidatus Cloacimonadota bacterium]|nr:carboxypeptidase regulatory-like domain-containing protein [Candidatus Cloacimonadota bacterium]